MHHHHRRAGFVAYRVTFRHESPHVLRGVFVAIAKGAGQRVYDYQIGGMRLHGFAQCFGVFAGRANLGRLGNDGKAPLIIPQGFAQSPQARAHTARALGGNV